MKTIDAAPGMVTIRGRQFAIMSPTKTDTQRIREKMVELARMECMNPIQAVEIIKDKLSPDILHTALTIAIGKASGGGAEPTHEAVVRAYDSLAGVRFQFWYMARKSLGSLTQDEVTNLIGDDDVYDLADALNVACSMPKDAAAPKA